MENYNTRGYLRHHKWSQTPLLELLSRYGLDTGKGLAETIHCSLHSAYDRLRYTDNLTIGELRLLSNEGGIPFEEVRAAL